VESAVKLRVKLRKANDSPSVGQRRTLALKAALLIQLLVPTASIYGQTPDVLRYAPDITVTLGGIVVDGGRLATDDLPGVTLVSIPNLPANARVAAAHRFANGDLLLAFESTLSLPGAGIVEPRDLVRFTSATQTFAVEVHGVDLQIPTTAAIDAVAVTSGGTILLSLDISVGGFDDEAVIAVNGSSLSLFLDTAAVGIATGLDLDGLDIEDEGADTLLYISFDGSGTVDGVQFDDEDLLLYNLTTQAWSLAYDGSAAAAGWPAAADLTALDVVLVAPPTATATATAIATGSATNTPIATHTLTATPTPTLPIGADTPTSTATATDTPTQPAATGTATATATGGIACAGDCDGDGEVAINELITLVNIALGLQPVSACPAGDINRNDEIAINEIITAVNNALNGCP
jgi:hypothetical protein